MFGEKCPKCGRRMRLTVNDLFKKVWRCDNCNISLVIKYSFNERLEKIGSIIVFCGVALVIGGVAAKICTGMLETAILAGAVIAAAGAAIQTKREEVDRFAVVWGPGAEWKKVGLSSLKGERSELARKSE